MKFNDRLFWSIAILAQNPLAFGFALVMVPILLVFAGYMVFEIVKYLALPALAVVLVLKLVNTSLKSKRKHILSPLVRLPQTPQLPSTSQPLLKGPQKW
jgi:hypothetical protein